MRNKIINTFWKVNWSIQSFLLRVFSKQRKRILPLYSSILKGSCIIISTHSDDEAIGCFCLIKSKILKVTIVYMGKYGSDYTDENKEIRRNELIYLCKKYDANFKDIGNNSLSEMIKELDPDYIFIPNPVDWNKEHFEVLKRFQSSISNDVNWHIFIYQETTPIPLKLITHGIPMNRNELKEKWLIISETYKSQNNLPWNRFMCNESINGLAMRTNACEVYGEISPDQLNKCISEKDNNINLYEDIFKYINKLIKVRQYVNGLIELK